MEETVYPNKKDLEDNGACYWCSSSKKSGCNDCTCIGCGQYQDVCDEGDCIIADYDFDEKSDDSNQKKNTGYSNKKIEESKEFNI